MSDSMTNVQIEDVLSSIRRLVAEGDKTRTDAAPVRTTEKLVLTPALRVGAERDINDDIEDPVLVLKKDETAQDRASLEATIAELEAAVTAQPDEWEPDGTEAAVAASALPSYVSRRLSRATTELVLDDETPAPKGAASANVDSSPLDDKPETESVSEKSDTVFRHFDRETLSRDATPIFAAVDDAQSKPDTDYGDDLIADEKPDPQIDAKLNAFLSDDAMLADAGLDEDTLRRMIVDVIREELQGALGERITRNVRKLVRREIHRVLAAQDFN